MPKAELIKPKSYNHLGRIWKQGEVVEITEELAAELVDNPRFVIRGSDAVRGAPVAGGKPKSRDALYEAIRDATDRLDVDNEAHFTVTGKPECAALQEILGYSVTAFERDQAIGVTRKPEVEASEPPTRVKIKKVRLTPAEAKSETVSHLPAEEPTVPATDPTTLNAIEVN